ncbi:yemanuclein [Drosophila ananassae]|nr:yemanuclein [Drosophila ananassae]
MSKEPRRISLTSIAQNDGVFSRFGSSFLDPQPELPGTSANQKASKTAKSIRIKLELFETDSDKYPEFNYSKLLYLEKKKAKKLKQVTSVPNGAPSDPFADNDDDVARIVKELEAKYGNAYATGRGKSKKDDYRDIGMGYDESDSFIDNTEAYDEIIPEEAETLKGGFYINCGALEFKNLTKKSYTTRTDAIIKMPERSRKRLVSSSSESSSSSSGDEDGNDDENDEDDDDDESGSEEEDEEDDETDSEEDDSDSESLEDDDSASTIKSSSKYKDNQAKKSKVIVTSKPKSSHSSSGSLKKPLKKPIVITSSSSNSPRPSGVDNTDTEERPSQTQSQPLAHAQALKKAVKTTTVKDMLKAKRDSYLKSQSGPAAVKGVVNGELKCISTDMDSSSDSSDSDSALDQGTDERHAPKQRKEGSENLRSADTVLPASLDSDILAAINNFKEAVRSRDWTGKKFSLDATLTPLFLKVYETVQCTDHNERNMVFSHIEYQLQLPKYYMLRKGKAVRAKEAKSKSNNAVEKLRRAVAVVMPKAIANYEMELRNFAEQAAADVNSELPPKMPRKKFQWSSELRLLLYDVYQARWTSYTVLAKRKDSLENFINDYLKEKVVNLWPQGWMRYDELQREILRHKSASRKLKEKVKTGSAVSKPAAAAAATATGTAAAVADQEPQSSNHLMAIEEPRSRGNSDTDSVTSASSASLKRKLNDQPPQSNKPPKKKAIKQGPSMQPQTQPQFQLTPAATAAVTAPVITNNLNNNHLPTLETLLSMPSTSAQAATLAAASAVLDLASPNRSKTDPLGGSSIYNLLTAATLGASGSPGQFPVDPQAKAKIVVGVRPAPHVINLDDYQCSSDILHTSKQLAATTSVITSTSSSASMVQVRDSSSESDGVEIVGVFPASKPKQSTLPKTKNKTQSRPKSLGGGVQLNGALGLNKNMYIFNNNNSGPMGAMYDLATNSQIMKAMSDLKVLEKKIKWTPTSSMRGAGGLGSPGTGTGAGAGTSPRQ